MNTHVNRHHYEEWVVDTLKELRDGTVQSVELPQAMVDAYNLVGAHPLSFKHKYDLAELQANYTLLLALAEWTDNQLWNLHQKAVKAHNEQWETQGKAAYEAIRASDEAALSQQVAGL